MRPHPRPWLLLGALAAVHGLAFAPMRSQNAAAKPPELTASTKQFVLVFVNTFMKTAYAPGADFAKWPQLLAEQRGAIDKAETPREFAAAVNGALHRFGVSHMALWTPQAAQSRSEKKTVGIGITLDSDPQGILVTSVFPGAPAQKAGIVAGDVIVQVGGKKPANLSALAGDEGTKVSIKVRKADGALEAITLTRVKFTSLLPPTLAWLSKTSAMLTVPTFDVAYDGRAVEKLMRDAAGAENLVVDLRWNPGGSLTGLTHLLGMFVKEGTPVGTFVTREVVDRFVKETGDKPDDIVRIARSSRDKVTAGKNPSPVFRGRVAVLVNRATGSCAEMAAAALHEVLGAPVVGSRSAGAVLLSVMRTLPVSGYIFQCPVADYVTLRGVRLEGYGVGPDVGAPTPRPRERDVAVDMALALLRRAELRGQRAVSPPPGRVRPLLDPHYSRATVGNSPPRPLPGGAVNLSGARVNRGGVPLHSALPRVRRAAGVWQRI